MHIITIDQFGQVLICIFLIYLCHGVYETLASPITVV